MMNSVFIAVIAIIVAILCIVLAIRFGKIFFKILGILFLTSSIVGLVFGSLVLNDAMAFKENIKSKNNIFVLEKNNQLLGSLILRSAQKKTGVDLYEETVSNPEVELNNKTETESELRKKDLNSDSPFIFLAESEFQKQKSFFERGDLESVKGTSFKLLIFDAKIFDGMEEETLNLGDFELTVDESFKILESDDVKTELINLLAEKQGLSPVEVKEIVSNQLPNGLRSVVFALLLSKVMGEDVGVTSMFKNLQDKTIRVYPETLMFKFLGTMPSSLIKSLVQKIEPITEVS